MDRFSFTLPEEEDWRLLKKKGKEEEEKKEEEEEELLKSCTAFYDFTPWASLPVAHFLNTKEAR